jgi:hypothetical protein
VTTRLKFLLGYFTGFFFTLALFLQDARKMHKERIQVDLSFSIVITLVCCTFWFVFLPLYVYYLLSEKIRGSPP